MRRRFQKNSLHNIKKEKEESTKRNYKVKSIREDKKKSITENYGVAKYNDMIEHLNDPDKIRMTEATIIPTFLKIAFDKIKESENVPIPVK